MAVRHALIIGIDRYTNFEDQYQLSGCVNDAKLLKQVLVDHFAFEPSRVTELHDTDANQQGILDAMDQLAARVGRNDVVVFHFSGHGRQRTSTGEDEGVGLDSTITPSDSGAVDPYPNLDITDDVIGDWIESLAEKTPYITLIFDCCHSGTITRDLSSAKIRGLPPDRRPLVGAQSRGRVPAATRSGGVRGRRETPHVVMSGCRDDQYSHEYCFEQGGAVIRSGALTHFLTRALLNARPGSTYRDVFERARQGVNAQFPQQHPQIEGELDREIFGVRNLEPVLFIPLVDVTGDQLTLRGGAAHGLTVNSVWTVYPQGTKRLRDAVAIGKIRVTEVHALTAHAEQIDGEALEAGARCVESQAGDDQFRLSLHLAEPVDDALREALSASPLLSIVPRKETADVQVQRSESDPCSAVIWSVRDRSGAALVPAVDGTAADAIGRLVDNLETVSRYRNALALDNPSGTLDVAFNIYRVKEDGELEDANGGAFPFVEGDHLVFELVNRTDHNVFVSVLDFGLTGRISLVFPTNRAGELVAPGKTFRYGLGRMKLRVGVPADFPGDRGIETLKAFISTDEADFRWLQQSGTRSVDGTQSKLRRQFEAAYHGPATRDLTSVEMADASDEDWIAPTRSFEVRRK